MIGLVWIVWGSTLHVGEAIPKGTAANFYWGVFPAVLVISSAAATWAIRKLKERVTYPRTGYIEYREPGLRVWVMTALLGVLSAGVIEALLVGGRSAGLEQTAAPRSPAIGRR